MVKPPIFIITDTLPREEPFDFLINVSRDFFHQINQVGYNQLVGLCSHEKWPFYKQDYWRKRYRGGQLPVNLCDLSSFIGQGKMKCFDYSKKAPLFSQAQEIRNIICKINSGSIILLSAELAVKVYYHLKSLHPKLTECSRFIFLNWIKCQSWEKEMYYKRSKEYVGDTFTPASEAYLLTRGLMKIMTGQCPELTSPTVSVDSLEPVVIIGAGLVGLQNLRIEQLPEKKKGWLAEAIPEPQLVALNYNLMPDEMTSGVPMRKIRVQLQALICGQPNHEDSIIARFHGGPMM